MSWISPAFGEDDTGSSSTAREGGVDLDPRARIYDLNSESSIWVERFEPITKEELAVNPKKVKGIETWLEQAFRRKFGTGAMALLVGPSGCGKTATIRALSRSMPFEIKEWVSPSYSRVPPLGESSYAHKGNEYGGPGPTSQLMQFEEFLFRASRYSDIFGSNNSNCLLLVEDIPYIFIHNPNLLEKTLQKYSEMGKSPLLFICSNSSVNFNLERMLFTPKLQASLKLANISFNPVSKTLMMKGLERVIKLVKKDNPSRFLNAKFPLEEVVTVANSDLRFAINHLQFVMMSKKGTVTTCTHPPQAKSTKRKRKDEGKDESSSPETSGGKDQPADVFRSLGRVLYKKRRKVIDENTKEVDERLVHNPEEIVSKMSSVPNLFQSLLVENYPPLVNDVSSMSEASDRLSQADIVMSGSSTSSGERELQISYGMNLSVHGMMSLPGNGGQKKFCPFRGSRTREVIGALRERKETDECMDEDDEDMSLMSMGQTSSEMDMEVDNPLGSSIDQLMLTSSDCSLEEAMIEEYTSDE